MVFPVKVSEIPDENLNADEQILDIARRKSTAAFDLLNSSTVALPEGFSRPFVVLGSDTEVIFEGRPLGKPSSQEDAVRTLQRLSGRSHEVITAVCLIDSSREKPVSHIETTRVEFRPLPEKEIRDYVATGEPMDKAGSYGIQGLGGRLVERIDGDFDNVVGLPIAALKRVFAREGWSFLP